MSLALHQIYNLHFYIIGLCLCCLLIVHPRLLIFSKWQRGMGKYFNKPFQNKKKYSTLELEVCHVSDGETQWETTRWWQTNPVMGQYVGFDTNLISFYSSQTRTLNRDPVLATVSSGRTFLSDPQKCIVFHKMKNNQIRICLVRYASLCCAVSEYDECAVFRAFLTGKSHKSNIYPFLFCQ